VCERGNNTNLESKLQSIVVELGFGQVDSIEFTLRIKLKDCFEKYLTIHNHSTEGSLRPARFKIYVEHARLPTDDSQHSIIQTATNGRDNFFMWHAPSKFAGTEYWAFLFGKVNGSHTLSSATALLYYGP
jgi:hypothetical protein